MKKFFNVKEHLSKLRVPLLLKKLGSVFERKARWAMMYAAFLLQSVSSRKEPSLSDKSEVFVVVNDTTGQDKKDTRHINLQGSNLNSACLMHEMMHSALEKEPTLFAKFAQRYGQGPLAKEQGVSDMVDTMIQELQANSPKKGALIQALQKIREESGFVREGRDTTPKHEI